MVKPKQVGHLVLNVSDVGASTKFYTEILALTLRCNGRTGRRLFSPAGRFTTTWRCFRRRRRRRPRARGISV